MKGHIFNLLEDFLIEQGGIYLYEQVITLCQFDSHVGFIRTEIYPDEQLYEMVGLAAEKLGIEPSQATHAFGKWVMPHLAALVPPSMLDHPHPRDFLHTLDHIHQVELKKLYPDATPPKFHYEDINDETGVLSYQSPRQLFDLVEGVLEGVSDFFHTEMQIERRLPVGRSGHCDFVITYPEARAA